VCRIWLCRWRNAKRLCGCGGAKRRALTTTTTRCRRCVCVCVCVCVCCVFVRVCVCACACVLMRLEGPSYLRICINTYICKAVQILADDMYIRWCGGGWCWRRRGSNLRTSPSSRPRLIASASVPSRPLRKCIIATAVAISSRDFVCVCVNRGTYVYIYTHTYIHTYIYI